MNIVFDHDDIVEAILNHVDGLGANISGTPEVDITAGRGPNGFTATVSFEKKSRKVKAKPATKAKPAKPEPEEEVAETTPEKVEKEVIEETEAPAKEEASDNDANALFG